ncbi:hypothetical protein [Cerasicoccus maritimus]|uniref:hypothetical protein n=1 Tax=Cerasicoccus maritimus TaxID=490089 RepID=UPI0028529279|nr:hypothetical protein [Cerasicoccus maritimus]
MKNPIILGMFAWAISSSAAYADITIDDYTDATNDRFTNDASFIAASYSLSAIGKVSLRWGTLVSSNVVLCANHYHPLVGQTMTFYATNDPNGDSQQRTVVAGERIGESDLWVGVLNEPLPGTYEPLPFMNSSITNAIYFIQSGLSNAEVFLLGRSPNTDDVALDTGVGKNRITSVLFNQSVTGTDDVVATGTAIYTTQNSSGDSAYVTYEAQLQNYDSGAPMLRVINGELTIVGVNWFVGSDGTNNISGATYVGNYAAEIQAIIDAYDGLSVPSGYGDWASTQFGSTDITEYPPNADNDGDGRTNYDEYALAYDPTTPDYYAPSEFSTADLSGSHYGQLTVTLQQNDNDLNYLIYSGADLSSLASTTLRYNSGWSVGNSSVAVISSATDNGDNTWTLTLRDATAVTEGSPRFMRVSYD